MRRLRHGPQRPLRRHAGCVPSGIIGAGKVGDLQATGEELEGCRARGSRRSAPPARNGRTSGMGTPRLRTEASGRACGTCRRASSRTWKQTRLRRPRGAPGPLCRCTRSHTSEMQAPMRCWACYTPRARLDSRTIPFARSSPTVPPRLWAPSPPRTRWGSCNERCVADLHGHPVWAVVCRVRGGGAWAHH